MGGYGTFEEMSFGFDGSFNYKPSDPFKPSGPSGGPKFPKTLKDLAMSIGWSASTSLLIGVLIALINQVLGLLLGIGFWAILFAQRKRYQDQSRSRGRSLYFTILSALLAYNAWTSLAGREGDSGGECGSWLRPVLDEDGTIGWFWSVGERECPQLIAGNFTEALFSAIFLSLLFAIQRLNRNS